MKKNIRHFITAAILVCGLSAIARAEIFTANLTGDQEVPTNSSNATGYARVNVNESAGTLTFTVVFNNLSSNQTASHIHAPAAIGVSTAVAINFGAVGGTSGTITGTANITPTQLSQIRQHLGYVNVHSSNFPGGEIRGQLGVQRPVDYDGDGRMDLSIWRFPTAAPPATAQVTYWNWNSSGAVQITNWGDANTDFPVPGDYDGDGKGDLALYRAGSNTGDQSVYYILRSSDNTSFIFSFGITGDRAVNRDYDGDGITDLAIFRKGAAIGDQAFWWIRKSSAPANYSAIPFGTTGDSTAGSGDTPVPGDYDGDGKFDVAVYRYNVTPSNFFIIKRSSDNVVTYQKWGNFATDYIVPGDYDGDGKTDLCAVRTGANPTSPLLWWILRSSDGQSTAQQFGLTSDKIVQGDYDGDARTDLAIYRPGATSTAASTFWIYKSFSNSVEAIRWGLGSDFPVGSFDAR